MRELGIVVLEENKGFKINKFSAAEIIDIRKVLCFKLELWALELAMEQGDAQWEADTIFSLSRLAEI